MGNSDALAVLASDACAGGDLVVVGDPVTLRSDCSPHDLASALAAVLEDPAVDSVVVAHVPVLGTDGRPWQAVVADTVARRSKPVVAVLVAAEEESGLITPDDRPEGSAAHRSVPYYGTVEDAVRALRRVTRYAEWRARPLGDVPEVEDVHVHRARVLVDALVGSELDDTAELVLGESIEAEAEAEVREVREVRDVVVRLSAEAPDDPLTQVLAAYGIDVWPSERVASEAEAVEVATRLGFPVVLKTLDPRFVSRTDLGGVRLNIENERAARTAYLSMVSSLDPTAAARLVVQRQASPGVACVVSSTEDPLFGPVVSFGLAGVVPELLGDRGYGIPPLTDVDARDLIAAPGASPMLDGFGGTVPVDKLALEGLLVRLGLLADDVPELAELTLEPVVVAPGGLAVLGANAVLRRPEARTERGARRLGS